MPPPWPRAGQPGDTWGSPIPGHHCGCHVQKAWGEGTLCPTMWAPPGLRGPLQPVGPVGPRLSLRMQVWPWLACLPALVLAWFGSQDDISTAFNFKAH